MLDLPILKAVLLIRWMTCCFRNAECFFPHLRRKNQISPIREWLRSWPWFLSHLIQPPLLSNPLKTTMCMLPYYTLARHWAALQICSSWFCSKHTGSDNAAATSLFISCENTVKWGLVECGPVSELAPVKQTCSRFYRQHTCRPRLVFFFAP